jgi:hypothetical protein
MRVSRIAPSSPPALKGIFGRRGEGKSVLWGRGDVSLHGQVGRECLHLGGAPISAGWRTWW